MTEAVHAFVDQIARFLELAGVPIIVGGTFIAGVVFVSSGLTTGGWRPEQQGRFS